MSAYSPDFVVNAIKSNGRAFIGELLSDLWSTSDVAVGEYLVGEQARKALGDAVTNYMWGDGKLGGEDRKKRAQWNLETEEGVNRKKSARAYAM